MGEPAVLYTVGHSNHSEERLLGLLRLHAIAILVDVRSQPFSRYNPQFNRETLQVVLPSSGINYLFLGDLLGGRPSGKQYYDEEGYVLYHEVAAADFFRAGLAQLEHHLTTHRAAIMCSEEDPQVCHRHLLIARVLHDHGIAICHIRQDGRLDSYEDIEPVRQQKMLFADLEHDSWRSLRSVLPKQPHANSLEG